MDYNISMSTRRQLPTTQPAFERCAAVVCPMPEAVEAAVVATHPANGKRGQNIDTKPGVSML